MDVGIKKGLMVSFPYARGREFVCKNIGDYIQSVAARQFCENADEYVQQEEADSYYPEDKRKIKLIMNGWFQWRAENWPPSEYIFPLLISMHISPLKEKEILTKEGIEFLKKYSPVGCRDIGTKKMLERVEVPCYFSGCLTLTLGKKYFVPPDQRKGIFFVDPFFDVPELIAEVNGRKRINIKQILSIGLYYLFHRASINQLAQKDFFADYLPTGFLDRKRNKYRAYYKATLFYKLYTKKFDRELLLQAEYITHWIDVDMKSDNDDKLLNIAEALVRKYASARMLVTSRIHAGLPALGLETPVVFVATEKVVSEKWEFNTPGRLDGLLELFRVYGIKNGKFDTNDIVLKEIKMIDEKTKFGNKTEWKCLARKLIEECENFMNG